jgi:hypothetical protein
MAKKQRIGYLLNEWMVAWLLFYAVILAFVVSGFWRDVTLSAYAEGAITILFVSAVMLGPFVVVKWLTIRRSKQRTVAIKAAAISGAIGDGSY